MQFSCIIVGFYLEQSLLSNATKELNDLQEKYFRADPKRVLNFFFVCVATELRKCVIYSTVTATSGTGILRK